MAVKNTDLGGTDWSDGDVLNAADLNDTMDAVQPTLVASTPYTGTGFDTTRNTTGTDSDDHTLSVAAAAVTKWIRIVIVAKFHSNCACASTDATGSTTLKIEGGETGSLATLFDQTMTSVYANDTDGSDRDTNFGIEFYWAPSSAEKAAGFDIKISTTSVSNVGDGSAVSSVTNIQTMVYAY